ncbi:MAG: ATPase [Bacteroidetes bacterium GWC2_33_15]|nr:MAG: ATPase [Bacteroidetes bacterium GWA2_33_15]OFX50463.1 MAG: ATPase [Bacteroidetes bacterium GWC2_33_15]OFX66619.1 MAG: ATPase [Bacteroidetes bacterium GWB2_32_14]OFX69237.1 MAG: ATPase [Bacteroidetes bacterium GWD2_33_33]HAN18548.1 ATP-binding protein [Bacteroidales bacterium]
MGKAALLNPFPTSGYYGPDYFCDRENETSQLIRDIKNGNSTTLIAIRRIGKTGLIHHTLKILPKEWKGIYIDILATETLTEFLNTLATSIIQAVPQKSSIGKKFWNFIQSLRPIITFDLLTGMPQASFDITQKNAELNISAVLKFIDSQDFKTVIAIDEFQQILNYPEKNTDAWLRTIIQQLKNVVFIFSGSQQHIMTELFASPSRPFFRSAQFLKLGKINKDIYAEFIIRKFEEYHKHIDKQIVHEIIEWCNGHTYYVQQLFNRIFFVTQENATIEIWHQQANLLLNEQEPVFINYRNLLTSAQWKLLKAIAVEGEVYSPTSKDFISKYGLGSSAALLRSLNSLRKYELIYSDSDSGRKTFYSVYDVFFQQWGKEKARKK